MRWYRTIWKFDPGQRTFLAHPPLPDVLLDCVSWPWWRRLPAGWSTDVDRARAAYPWRP